MKKIFLFFAAVTTLFACDPTHEDISNDGNITVDELKAMSSVTVDKDANGKWGNIITCTTSAPVNAKWTIDGKDALGNYTKKKMRVGDYTVILTGLCADGTEVKAEYPVSCEVETDPIKKKWFYGQDPAAQPEFWLESGDAAAGRFSDNEGKYFPYLDGATYFGLKTLVFEITAAEEGPFIWGEGTGLTMRVMNGWWSSTYAEDVVPTVGYWELPITQKMADECASTNDGGAGKDLDLLMTRGKIKIKACYYEY
jgi:hypothetical protein